MKYEEALDFESLRNLKKDESVDLITDLTARKLKNRLVDIEDDEGYSLIFRCQGIPGGVRVTCTSRFKITGVWAKEVVTP